MKTINKIPDDSNFNFEGDTLIEGSIGKNSNITITDGDLTIRGIIESGVTINLRCSTLKPVKITTVFAAQNIAIGMGNIYFEGVNVQDALYAKQITIENSLQENVKIQGEGWVNISINGDLADHVRISTRQGFVNCHAVGNDANIKSGQGDITCTTVASRATIRTSQGNISCGDVAAQADISTSQGNISCGDVAAQASIKTSLGNISCGDVAAQASIKTSLGNIQCGNVANGVAKVHSSQGNINCTSADENATQNISSSDGEVIIAGKKIKKKNNYAIQHTLIFVSDPNNRYPNYRTYTEIENKRDDSCCPCTII